MQFNLKEFWVCSAAAAANVLELHGSFALGAWMMSWSLGKKGAMPNLHRLNSARGSSER